MQAGLMRAALGKSYVPHTIASITPCAQDARSGRDVRRSTTLTTSLASTGFPKTPAEVLQSPEKFIPEDSERERNVHDRAPVNTCYKELTFY